MPAVREEWRVVHLDHSFVKLGEAFPSNLDFAVFLSKIGHCNYDLSFEDGLANSDNVYPYRTDYVLYRGQTLALQGGIHVAVEPDIDNRVIQISGNDYLHYLERRWYPFDPTNLATGGYTAPVGTDIAVIVKKLLDDTLAVANSLPLTYTLPAVGQTVNDFKIPLGDTEMILAKIETLSKRSPGFDYEITPAREFKMYAPKKGSNKTFVFEQGRNCSPTGYVNRGPQATHTLGIAQGSGNKRASAVTMAAAAGYRRMDKDEQFNTQLDQTTLDSMTLAEAQRNSAPTIEFSVSYIPEDDVDIWREVWVGDTVRVHADVEYAKINDKFRIVGIENRPDDAGNDDITFTFDDGTLSQ